MSTPSQDSQHFLKGRPPQAQRFLGHVLKGASHHARRLALILGSKVGVPSSVVLAAALLSDKPPSARSLLDQVDGQMGSAVQGLLDKFDQLAASPAQVDLLDLADGNLEVVKIWLAKELDKLRIAPTKQTILVAERNMLPWTRRLKYPGLQKAFEELLLSQMEGHKAFLAKFAANKSNFRLSLNRIGDKLQSLLLQGGFSFKLQKRLKSTYSTYQKMVYLGCTLEKIYDLLGFRLVLAVDLEDEITQCWAAAHQLQAAFSEKVVLRREWLFSPKASGYQALHLTLKEQEWFEVQIRSVRMHEVATTGTAAHWKYKRKL